MGEMTMKKMISRIGRFLAPVMLVLCLAATAFAAVPGVTGTAFNLTAQPGYLNQPDGEAVYSWGYGCNSVPTGFLPAAITNATCPTMQVPGPTLIVHENDVVTVTLTNNLPTAAGNTSILFPGFNVTSPPGSGVAGLLTQEAASNSTVRGHTRITAARRATSRWRWACTARSSCFQGASPPTAPTGRRT